MRIDLRVAASVLLLAAATHLTWATVQGLEKRRNLRTQLAEISHVKYGLLNADRWVEILLPALNKQVDALDLAPAQGASLRPMVQNALYRLLDDVKVKMSAKPAEGTTPMLGQGNPLIVNMIVSLILALISDRLGLFK